MSREDERNFLRTNQVLVALVGMLVGLVGYFLASLHNEIQDHFLGSQKTAQAVALLTQIVDQDHAALGGMDVRVRTTEQDIKVLQRIVAELERKR